MDLRHYLLALAWLPAAAADEPTAPGGRALTAPSGASHGDLPRLARNLIGKKDGNDWFYFPTHDEPATPGTWGFKYETVNFAAADGTQLHGWFIPGRSGKTQAKATVVFSHGNAGAIGHHLGFVMWFAEAGYNVLMYDYRGFGKSAGWATRRGVINDAKAAFAYAGKRIDVDARRLISYGHSLGGATSVTALGETRVAGLRAVVVDGAFASYKTMARIVAGQLGADLVSDDLSPRDFIAKLSPVPLLVVHGTRDEVVPVAQGRELYQNAREPKTLFEVKTGRHGDSLARDHGAFRKRTLAWLEAALRG